MGSGKTHEPKWVLVDFTSVNIEPQPDGSKVIVVKGETPELLELRESCEAGTRCLRSET